MFHRILLLAISSVLFSLTGLRAQQDKPKDSVSLDQTQLLKEVLLSSNILGSKFEVKNRTGSAYYVSPQELEQFGYTDVNKILRAVPGVNIYEEDGFGLRPNISLRGTSPQRSARITLMEDNVLIAPAPYSAPAAYYFPTVGRMRSIEVLKGSSQVQYGPYTTGGAINMVSRNIPQHFGGAVNLNAGNYSGRNVEASLGSSRGRFGFVTQVFNYSSDGFKHLNGRNTGFDKTDLMGKFRFTSGEDANIFQSLTLKVQYAEEDSNETYLGLTDADFERDAFRRYAASQVDNMQTQHSQFQVDHLIKPSSHLDIRTTAYLNGFKRNWYKLDDVLLGDRVSIGSVVSDPETYPNEYRLLLGDIDSPADALGVKANNRSYHSRGIQTRANLRFGTSWTQELEVGLRYHEDSEDRFQWKDLYGMQNGIMNRTTAAIPGTDANRISSARALAAHTLYKLTISNLTLTPGLRYEYITLKREDYGRNDPNRTGAELSNRENQVDVFIPGMGLQYRFGNELSLFGGVHKGFAPPGSRPDTDPEESINLELGARFDKIGVRGELVGFLNDYSNLLGSDLAASGGTGSLEQFNAGEALVQGIELLLNYDLLGRENDGIFQLPLTLSYTFTDARFTADFDSDDGIFGEVRDGDQIPYIARNQFNLTAALEHREFNLNLSGRYTDQLRTRAGSGPVATSEQVGSNFIIDFSARYFLTEKISLNANIYNLLDSTYAVSRVPAGLRPGAPFTLNAGVRYKI